MAEKLKLIRSDMPIEFVLFDHNPQSLRVERNSSSGRGGQGKSLPGGEAGTLGALFHGTDPLTLRITNAHLVGPETKPMCDTLTSWMSPASGVVGAVMTALGVAPKEPPVLLVQWGPPSIGFTVQATLTSARVDYLRFDDSGVPVHAQVTLTLKEAPSILSMTNPTSGGRPGRRRHTVTSDETLMSIAMQSFGDPGAWRAIAEVNGIDDPAAIRPGDVVYLPARDELRELAGERSAR